MKCEKVSNLVSKMEYCGCANEETARSPMQLRESGSSEIALFEDIHLLTGT